MSGGLPTRMKRNGYDTSPLSQGRPRPMLGKRIYGPASLFLCIPASLPHTMHDHVREVVGVYVEPQRRQRGIATELMQGLCREADATGMILMLIVEPGPDTRMTNEQLRVWYAGFGFVIAQLTPAVMMYRPVHVEVVH